MNRFTQSDVDRLNQRVRVGKVVAAVKPLVEMAKPKAPNTKSYNPKIVTAFFAEHGIPAPEYEYRFDPNRRWKFDIAWPNEFFRLALEVQGGIFSNGRHNRGAAMLKEWEKLNEASAVGWRIIYCQPSELCITKTAQLIKRCL